MKVFLPRIEIDLAQIRHNAKILAQLYAEKGISLMGVSKAVLGNPAIAMAMIQGGVEFIADSRLENIQRMKEAGIVTPFVLLRTALSQAELVVKVANISLNTELETIKQLSYYAVLQGKLHKIILMVELGDLREGILPKDLSGFIRAVLDLPKIKIIGIGCNLACFGGIRPNDSKMSDLSILADAIEQEFKLQLAIVSGGNSANYDWFTSTKKINGINNLRIGESILLGYETINRTAIPALKNNAFTLIAEVIESKCKPSLPFGESCQDAFGNVPLFLDRGDRQRVILALGRQDVLITGLKPIQGGEILGASSDHIVFDSDNHHLKIGSEVRFNLDYGGLLAAMTSPFVTKQFVNCV